MTMKIWYRCVQQGGDSQGDVSGQNKQYRLIRRAPHLLD